MRPIMRSCVQAMKGFSHLDPTSALRNASHTTVPTYRERSHVQATLKPLDVQQTKDIETTVAGIRADKVKEKTASDAAKKGEAPTSLCYSSPKRMKGLSDVPC